MPLAHNRHVTERAELYLVLVQMPSQTWPGDMADTGAGEESRVGMLRTPARVTRPGSLTTSLTPLSSARSPACYLCTPRFDVERRGKIDVGRSLWGRSSWEDRRGKIAVGKDRRRERPSPETLSRRACTGLVSRLRVRRDRTPEQVAYPAGPRRLTSGELQPEAGSAAGRRNRMFSEAPICNRRHGTTPIPLR
jgi:hypothetical protein